MEVSEDKLSENSGDENEMNIINVNTVRKKCKTIDSDSETEDKELESPPKVTESSEDKEISNTSETETTKKRKLKRVSMINSESEDEDNVNKTVQLADISNPDSVEEEEITPHNKSFPDEATAVEAVIYTTNNKGDLIPENAAAVKKSCFSLYDSDTSEEETEQNTTQDYLEEKILQPKVYKKPTRKKNEAEKPKKMTAQEAAKQKTEIHSESQRMLREANVSLPYHKPKSYTIKEFLEKRAKLASALPLIPKAPPSVAIKMSKDQLEQVSKKLDERMKEVEEFYKSESEEEEEDTEDASEEIRSWLDLLVDKAVDLVETKMVELTVEEFIRTEAQKNTDTLENVDQEEPMECTSDLVNSNEEKLELEDSEIMKDQDEEVSRRATTLELLKDKLSVQPRLSGTPDDIIDLDEGVAKPSEVKKLVEKFLQHTAKKVSHKHKVHLDVVGVGIGGQIIKETVSMNVDEEEEPVLVETPGAKLQRLREELQIQMAQKRLEMWKQKQEQGDCFITEKKIDECEDNKEKDILDDEEEEFEMTESESDEEEDEEEDYDLKPEKPKLKSAFIDEEAEEDEVEDDEGNDVYGGEEEEEENDGDIDECVDNEQLESPKKKVLKRIVKPFTEDSDDEEDDEVSQSERTKIVKYYTTDDDDVIPPNLPRTNVTPQRPQIEKNKSEFDFLTPVTYLTGLQNLNSDSKLKESPNDPFCVPEAPSPVKEINSQADPEENNLVAENLDCTQNTQDKIEEIADLCSGKFPETQKCFSEEKSSILAEELPPTTQELLNVCSGDFVTMAEPASSTVPQTLPSTSEKLVINTQSNAEKEIKSLDEDQDLIISQLLDEDELERFKKKFESPVNLIVRKNQIFEDIEEVNATGLINSDDENEGLEIKTRKRKKKLVFSDDENSDDDEEVGVEEEDEIDLHDDVDDEEQPDFIDDEEQELENEVAAQESSNFKLTDFLDKEAELSESEWGSADEDEKGLDELDFEEGDEEKFNEKKMRTELERIHMRQVLDEDNREVKLLQELLLEDGELHGTGRKRQFRWRTLDSVDNGEFDKRDDDDIFLDDEEESEEHYRKMRHKREMFLKKKVNTEEEDDDDSILGDSQILKVGQKILKTTVTSQSSTPVNKTEEIKEPFSLFSKRGSFLTRKDQVLQRLAEYNKVTTTLGSTAKNSKCFVFQTVETSETTTIKDNNNKRKAAEGTPNVIKKLRLDDLSPAGGKKAGKNSRAKKLFGNW